MTRISELRRLKIKHFQRNPALMQNYRKSENCCRHFKLSGALSTEGAFSKSRQIRCMGLSVSAQIYRYTCSLGCVGKWLGSCRPSHGFSIEGSSGNGPVRLVSVKKECGTGLGHGEIGATRWRQTRVLTCQHGC